MTVRRVPRAVTEEAIHYLHATYVDQIRVAAATPPGRGRVLTNATALGAYDSAEATKQACFFRMISVVEAYLDTLSAALFRERAPTSHDLVRRLIAAAELRASATWDERKTAFANYHGVSLGQLARWSELDCGIEVRNAIAHGLGKLTPRQRTKRVRTKIGQIGVRLSDGAVVVTDASLQRCRDACVEFIRSLDNALIALPA